MNPRFPKPDACRGCSLEHVGFGFAPPSGPSNARLILVGEALGYEEAIAGEPFYGAAGGMLSRILIRAGIDRRQCRIANVVSCRPPGDHLTGAPWEEHAIGQCRGYLQAVLDEVPDNAVVVPLGAVALGAVLHLRGVAGVQVKDFHGTVSRDPSNRFWVVPTFHPSHLQRGSMNLLEVVTQDLQVADRVSQRGFQRSPTTLIVDPPVEWFRSWCQDHAAKVRHDPGGWHLSCDTEFAEKAGGVDESEIVLTDGRDSPITRINGGNDALTGWTVPYREPYRGIYEELLKVIAEQGSYIWLWNKYADVDKLRHAGHTVRNDLCMDGMWLWHYLQSDLPRGLGFVAAMASDFGPWKHWGKDRSREGEYAAADGVQNWRTCMWAFRDAVKAGIWDLFLSDWHERDVYVLRPAYEQGTPANRQALEAFHAELQVKLASVLEKIKTTAAQGVLKPKDGYAKRPKGKPCAHCAGEGMSVDSNPMPCTGCGGSGYYEPLPPASILGKPKKGGGEAKSQYMSEGVKLIERDVDVEIAVCVTCGAEDVGAKHRCPVPKAAKLPRRKKGEPKAEKPAPLPRPVAVIETRRVRQVRYFWQLPFNPDAPAQVLQYLADQGIEAPVDKKKRDAAGQAKKTTAKKELEKLKAKYSDDPFFQLQLDWKAVQKVDSTYAVGALARLDRNDRLHPEFLPKPSTFRDSCVGINLQNVVADKAGPDGLASGFRRCIEARQEIPADRTEEEIEGWRRRWGGEG